MKPLALLLALALPLTAATTDPPETPAIAPEVADGPAKEALELFRQGRHAEAVKAAKPLAEEGNPDAIFLIGFSAETGKGGPQSLEVALESYKNASEKGHEEATYRRALILLNSKEEADRQQGREALEGAAKGDPGKAGRILGEAYLRGLLGEKPDFANAALWFKRASEAGDTASIIILARLYTGDFGFPEKVDQPKAIELFRKAAKLDEKAAYLPLGSRLLNGGEEIRNEKEGREWIDKAIEAELIAGYLALGDFEENVRKDEAAAHATYLKGAEAGQPDCMLQLSRLLLTGRGVAKDEAKAREWIDKAAQAGNPTASYQMASLLSNDEKPELAKIYGHLISAANGGLAIAQNELGLLYLSGNLAVADPVAAAAWLTRAAKAGMPNAQNNLATLFERGMGLPVNYANAGELYTLAANQGHGPATTALARMNAQGIGTKPNLVRAWALATLAIERGDEGAKTILGELSPQLTPELLAEAKKDLELLKSPAPKKETPAEK